MTVTDAIDMNLGRRQEMVRDRDRNRVQSMVSQRAGHNWVTEQQHTHIHMYYIHIYSGILFSYKKDEIWLRLFAQDFFLFFNDCELEIMAIIEVQFVCQILKMVGYL